MLSKQKSPNDSPQFNPLSVPGGRGKGSMKFWQSNTFKIGLAGVLVIVVVFIARLLFFSSSDEPRSMGAAGFTTPAQPQPPPVAPPMPQVPATSPPSPDQGQPAETTGQAGEHNQAGESPAQQSPPGEIGTENTSPGTTPPATTDISSEPLPEDFSKWDKEEFLRARKENHPKLLEAVAYLGENSPGKAAVAQTLAELLKTPKPDNSSDSPYATSPVYANPGLIETTIFALGKNGSQAARQILIQVLSGKFTTDDDRVALEAVLKTLVQLSSAENDEILLKLLISPELIRPASTGQATMQPQELFTRALDLVKQNASENLRVKLAENLVQKGWEANDPILNLLLEDNLTNLGAQLVLYQSEDLTSELKSRLEQYFLKYASQAIAMTMSIPSEIEGMPPSGTIRGGPAPGYRDRTPSTGRGIPSMSSMSSESPLEKLSDYEYGVHLAKLLWGEPLASLMSQSLADTRSLERQAPEIVLASTLPLDSIRAAMLKMLKKRASEGPQSLELVGWTDRVLTDPGLVVVLKMLPRSRSLKGVPLTGGGTLTGRYPPRRPGGPEMSGAYPGKEQSELDWINTLSKLLGVWCNRFDAAAQAQKRAARRGQKPIELTPTRMDEFELPPDAKIAAAYQLNWPEKAPEALGDIKPGTLKIQFFRLEQESTIKKISAAMKRLARGSDVHEMNNGFWLESIKNGSQPNTKRSLDIVVTAPNMQPQAVEFPQKEEPADFQIDILAIEISDPLTSKD